MTAIHFACICAKIDAVQLLLKHGADANIRDDIRDRTALFWTQRMTVGSKKKAGKQMSLETSQEIQQLLLEHNANPKIADRTGKSPLDWAQKLGHLDELKQLQGYVR